MTNFAIPRNKAYWITLPSGRHVVVRFITPTFRGVIAVPKDIFDKYKDKKYVKVRVFSLKHDGTMEIYEDKVRFREHKCGVSGTCRVFILSRVIWKDSSLIVVVI